MSVYIGNLYVKIYKLANSFFLSRISRSGQGVPLCSGIPWPDQSNFDKNDLNNRVEAFNVFMNMLVDM